MPRLFTGIEVPTATRDALAMLRGGFPGARWIDAENYHLTLRFIGDIDGRTASDIAEILPRVRPREISIAIEGLASFGGRRPHAIIAKIAPTRDLTDLHAEHERLMRRLGLSPETRRFTPHITLARLRGASQRDVADYLSHRDTFAVPPFTADRFVLFSARESMGGGPYIVEEAYPLSAEAA